jgi:transcriptional regulator with XRE-family HTH domain
MQPSHEADNTHHPAERRELRAFGHAVRDARRRRDLSSIDLARTLGIARQRLAAIETGQGDSGYKLMRAIARALNKAPSALLAQTETLDTAGER